MRAHNDTNKSNVLTPQQLERVLGGGFGTTVRPPKNPDLGPPPVGGGDLPDIHQG